MSEPLPITWKALAAAYPEFVQWIVQTFGGVPEGPVIEDDYNRYKSAYEARENA